jgi:hypothetical protein
MALPTTVDRRREFVEEREAYRDWHAAYAEDLQRRPREGHVIPRYLVGLNGHVPGGRGRTDR